jgi:hypothetical protein
MKMSDASRELLTTEYQELCRSHSGITDFRAKLLALLPIASGTGIGLLVFQVKSDVKNVEALLLIGLGVFGALVTFALFFYELRQIDVCKQLRNHGAWLERELGIDAGQFGGRRQRLSLREAYSPRLLFERDERLKAMELAGETAPRGERQTRLLRKPLIGAEAAGYLVYHAVTFAWLAIGGIGLYELVS